MKNLFRKIVAGTFAVATLATCVSCGNNKNPKKTGFSEIKAESTVSNLDTTGYVAKMLYGNIENWTISALENNPGIIDQIAYGPYATYITDILTDKSGLIEGDALKVAVDKNHGANGGRAFMQTSFKTNITDEIEYDIKSLEHATTDFSGFKGILFYINASEYGEDGATVGIGFRETDTDENGASKGVKEKLCLDVGVKYFTIGKNDSSWKESYSISSNGKQENKGRVHVDAGFEGWVYIPNESNTFVKYDTTMKTDGVFNARKVDSFFLAVEGSTRAYRNSIYLSNFSIVGDVNGDQSPVDLSGIGVNGTVKEFFTLDDLALGESKNTSGWEMVVWFTEYAGKLLTGVSLQYAADGRQELLDEGNKITQGLAEAQKPDGYLGVYTNEMRFGQGGDWDAWGHYHLIYGLISWYRVTGNEQALDVAVKASDCIYDFFMGSGKTVDSVGNQTMNLAICHSFAELYKETGTKKYLEAAKKIVDEEFPLSGDWMNIALEGKDFYESSLPRWEAIHPILALGTLYEVTGEEKYFTAFENIWWSIAKTDRHNNGGFCTTEYAQGNPYGSGSIETCCTVAWQAFTSMYLQFARNSICADELELSYYNAIFGGLLDDERLTTYDTPMDGKTRVTAKSNIYNDVTFLFHSGARDFTCCQANIARGIGEVSSWAFLTDKNGVYLNFYGEGSLTGLTPSNSRITLTQETQYPLNGAIKITISDMNAEETFDFALRIPSWTRSATVKVNGESISDITPGQYCKINRTWKNGDVIELSIDYGFHYWVNEQDNTMASVYYGPILLSFGSSDGAKFTAVAFFNAENFNNAQVSFANDGEHWMQFTVTGEKTTYTFYDFASFGKNKAYKTWMKVDNLPAMQTPVKFEKPIWCNR